MKTKTKATIKLKSRKMKRILIGKDNVAGVQFTRYQKVIYRCKPGTKGRLFGEPTNTYDSLAIRVEFFDTKVGYIKGRSPLQLACHDHHKQGHKLEVEIVSANAHNPTWQAFYIAVYALVNERELKAHDGIPM